MANHEWKHELNKVYPAGTRIELERMDDPYRKMPAGLKGTVNFVDDAGQIHVSWDNGSSLALVPGEDDFRKLPEAEHTTGKSNADRYIDHINGHILPFIDYSELQTSYETDMDYAKGVLNRLHEAMVKVYGGEHLNGESGGADGFVVIPGVVRGRDSGKMCLALLELDLSSSGEHWGTSYLCRYGVVPQDSEGLMTKGTPIFASEEMNKAFIPYDYGYAATISGDIHISKSKLPEAIRGVLNDFRNHRAGLLFNDSEDEAEIVGSVSFVSGETFNYTDAEEYIGVIKEELPYRSTSGFKFTTLTDDPRVRKAVDDLVYNEYGEENPRDLDSYSQAHPGDNGDDEDAPEYGDDD